MQDTPSVNEGASIRRVSVGFRYPEDRVALVDAIARRRGVDRSDVLADAADRLIRQELPGALDEAA